MRCGKGSFHCACKRVLSILMAVVLVVGLMPLPAFQAKAYADDAPLTAGVSQLFAESEAARTDAQALPAAEPEELETQAAGSIVFSAKNFTFNLYPGYSGCLKAITVKNNGTAKVTDIKLSSFTAKTTTVIDDDESGTTKQDTIPYVYTNEYGTVRYDSCYLESLDSWADDEKFELAPGASKTLYFTVASPFRAGYTLPTGTDVTDTVQISSSAGTGTLTFRCRVYDPGNVYAKVGTEYSPGSISGPASLNFGTVAAGTPLEDDNHNFYNTKNIFFQNMSTATDPNTGAYPNITVDSVTIEGADAGIFQDATPGLYSSRMTIGQGAWYERTIAVDATYMPAGTYTATLCYHISPYKVSSNAGDTTDGIIRVPMTVKVTGTNPNIPAAVTGLEATAGNGYVGLSWNKLEKPSESVTGYVIWRTDYPSDAPGEWSLGEVFDVNETTFVDKQVENGKTYTYYVTPRFPGDYKYMKKSNYASATPSGSAQGRPLAPFIHKSDTQNGSVRLTWSLDPETQHQFDKGDGKGVDYDPDFTPYPAIDHFNIYKDGSLVATYSQNAYESHYDEMYYFPSGYWESKSSYYWVYDVPVDDPYQYHKFRVSAVTKTGAESYLSIEDEGYSGSDVPLTTRLEASWTQGSGISLSFGWETETWIEYVGYGISYTVERKEAGESSFRKVHEDRTNDTEATWVDSTAVAGKTYVYRVVGTNSAGAGTSKEVTISTAGASAALPQFGYDLWSVADGTLSASAFVYSNNTTVELLRKKDGEANYNVIASKTVSNDSVEFTDTPSNGTYTYYMRFSLGGSVDSSRSFVWERAEDTSYDDMLKPPGEVTSVTITPGDRKFLFSWDPPATGGKVESYQICEYLVSPDGPSITMDSMQVVPGSETSYLCEDTYHNGEWYPPFNGTEYLFVIRAVNAAGVSDWTYLDKVSPNGDDWSAEPPAAPKIDEENTKVQWNADLNEWVMHIEWMPGEEGGAVSGYYATADIPGRGLSGEKTKADELSCDIRMGVQDKAGIKKGTYAIRVAAYNSRAPLGDDWKGGVASTYSYTYGTASAAPLAPRVYSEAPDDQAYIRLNLQPAEGDSNAAYITSYEVSRSETQGGPYASYATVAANGASAVDYYDTDVTGFGYSDGSWVNAKTYYYQVVAKSGAGTSDFTSRSQTAANISNSQRDAARNANTGMAGLPDSTNAAAVLAAKDTIAALRTQYDALTTPARVTFVQAENLAKLTACEAALATAEDAAAAQAVDAKVAALGTAGSIAVLLDQDEVTAKASAIAEARAAYDALTPAQLVLVAPGTLGALTDAESAIEVAETRVLIKAIPATSAMTVDSLGADRNKVVNARAAYDGLTPEQKTTLENLATSQSDSINNAAITAAEAKIADNEALVDVKALIDALPDASDLTNDSTSANYWKNFQEPTVTARAAYDALTDAQKTAVGQDAADHLTAVEGAIANFESAARNEAKPTNDAIDAIPDSITQVNLADAIEKATQARNAYNALTDPEARACVNLAKLQEREAQIVQRQREKLAADCASAAITGGVAYLKKDETALLTATSFDDDTITMSWGSSDTAVASVTPSPDGTQATVAGLKGAEEPISITMTYARDGYDAQDGNGKAKLTYAVSKAIIVAEATLGNAGDVVYDHARQFTIDSTPQDAYTWTSSDLLVASVDQTGLVTGVAQGKVTITATGSTYGIEVSKEVNVVPIPLTGITLSPGAFTHNGASQKPTVTVRCADGVVPALNGSGMPNYVVQWPADTSSVGVKTVTVKGLNDYGGTRTATYRINSAYQAMHRLYNPNSGEHFYTASAAERDHLVRVGWSYEGEGWKAPTSGADVYRLYNPNAGDHHYTTSAAERDHLVRVGWSYEGVGWKSGGSVPLYRQYNPNAIAGAHNYTTSKAENDFLVRVGWRAEGVGWYGV